MPLFGFQGRLQDARAGESTLGVIQARLGAAACISESPDGRIHACWGAHTAADDGLLVAVQGRPHFAGESEPSAHPAQRALAAYRLHGREMLTGMQGRFALAVIDAPAQRLLLAVDPMGIERLVYARRGSWLAFGESAEAVADFPAIGAPLSKQGLYNYLLHHMVPAPDTVFAGVHKLRAGTCAWLEAGRLSLQRFWQPSFREHGGAPFATLRAELRDSLERAVRSCEPDARTGTFLSGGLDSSSVAGVLSEVGPRPTRTFSIGFGYPQYDELAYARIANARFGCQGHEYIVRGDDIAATFPLIARAYDEPFGNSSALPVYYCAHLARDNGVGHLLAGDGGDELFAGNSRYVEQRVFEWYRHVPAPLRRGLLEPLIGHWPARLSVWPVRKARGYIDKANIPLPARLEAWNVIYRTPAAELLHPEFIASIDPGAPIANMREQWDAVPDAGTLNRMLYYDWQYTLADNDLRKVETMSALAGVRVSYPMLHPAVVALSLRVPPGLKIHGSRLRHFYRRAMQGFLPDEIIDKKKHGFGLPFGLWLQDSARLRELIFGNLSSLRTRSLLRPEFVDRLLKLHGREDASYYGVFVWVLAMLEQWLSEHRRSVT